MDTRAPIRDGARRLPQGVRRTRAAVDDADLSEDVTGAEDLDHQPLAVSIECADANMAGAADDGIDRIRHVAFREDRTSVPRLDRAACASIRSSSAGSIPLKGATPSNAVMDLATPDDTRTAYHTGGDSAPSMPSCETLQIARPAAPHACQQDAADDLTHPAAARKPQEITMKTLFAVLTLLTLGFGTVALDSSGQRVQGLPVPAQPERRSEQ